jgi:hypothetical protein
MSKHSNMQRLRVFKTWVDEFHSRLKRSGKLRVKRKIEDED